MFEKSLTDLVKGIRSHKDTESIYISKCLGEIKEEVKSTDHAIKAQAVQKLIFLQMLGYDISGYAFNIVEVMSAPWIGHKRVGYLAAAQSFNSSTDVLLLCTHLFRKGFSLGVSGGKSDASALQYETGAAITCLASVCNRDMAMDLLSDVYGMLNSSRAYVRKKAVLVLLAIFKAWPKALRLSFDRLKEKLNDSDPGVVAAAVAVIGELARKNPNNYVVLAPMFFKILTSSQNNWVLIKVVKLMGCLVPLEPRLAKKLGQPLSEIIESTPAKSLMYECVNTLLSGQITSKSVVRLCLDKLRELLEDHDQNLKYLGLLGLHKLMKQHPRAVDEHTDVILACLIDEDETIRVRALDLIAAMVSKRNIKSIMRRLMEHLEVTEGNYREHVLEKILEVCSQDSYAYVADFEWYVSLLVDMTHLIGASVENAHRVKDQLMDVAVRVEAVQPFAVRSMIDIIMDPRLHDSKNSMSEVLFSAAWIVGEFARDDSGHAELIHAMLNKSIVSLSQKVQNVFIHSFIKVLAKGLRHSFLSVDVAAQHDPLAEEAAASSSSSPVSSSTSPITSLPRWKEYAASLIEAAASHLPVFATSNFVEVQERAVAYLSVLEWLSSEVATSDNPGPLVDQLVYFFSEPLNPVSAKAQSKVQVPKGLNLDKWINEPEPSSDEEESSEDEDLEDFLKDKHSMSGGTNRRPATQEEREQAAERAARARARREQDPYYIKSGPSSSARDGGGVGLGRRGSGMDDIPISAAPMDLPPLEVEDTNTLSRRKKGNKKADRRRGRPRGFSDDDDAMLETRTYTVKRVEDAPVDKEPEKSDKKGKRKKKKNDTAENSDDNDDLGNVDLTKPLGADEIIPRTQTYAEQNKKKQQEERERQAKLKSKKKDKKKDKKRDRKRDKKKGNDEDGDSTAATMDILNVAPPSSSSAVAASGGADAFADDEGDDEDGLRAQFDPFGTAPASAGKKHDKKDKKKKKDKRHGKKDKKKDKDKDKDKKKHRHTDDEEDDAEEEEEEEVEAHPLRIQTVYADKLLTVTAVVEAKADKGHAAWVHLTLGSTGDLSKVAVQVGSNNFVRVRDPQNATVKLSSLAAGKSKKSSIKLQLASKLNGPQELTVKVKYAAKDKDKTVSKESVLQLPCSALVVPIKQDTEAVSHLMSAAECSCLATAQVVLSKNTVQEALKLVPHALNVRLVRAANFTAMYYGRTTQGTHVAVLVKTSKDQVQLESPSIAVDVKSGEQWLSDALLAEVQQHFEA